MFDDEDNNSYSPRSLPVSHFSLTAEEKETLNAKLQEIYLLFESSYRYQAVADRASCRQSSYTSMGSFPLNPNRHSYLYMNENATDRHKKCKC